LERTFNDVVFFLKKEKKKFSLPFIRCTDFERTSRVSRERERERERENNLSLSRSLAYSSGKSKDEEKVTFEPPISHRSKG